MELHKLHVHQFSAGLIRKRVSVASAFPTIAGDAERFADAAGGQNDGFRLPNSHAAALAVVTQHAGNFAAGCQQRHHGHFHEHFHALVNAVILQRANKFKASAIANVRQTRIAMATEIALQNFSFFGAIKHRAP